MRRKHKTHSVISLVGAITLAIIAFLSGVAATLILTTVYTQTITASETFPTHISIADDKLQSLAAVVYDENTKQVLYGKNVHVNSTSSIRDALFAGATPTTTPLLQKIPGLITVKSGYTQRTGDYLVVAFNADIGHPLVAMLFGSTSNKRIADAITIIFTVRNSTP
jgi:D-alanyl-D-alanine carboxypeptidase